MTEQDRALARRARQRNRLSSQQVEQLLEEAGRTGRPFRDLAIGRGLLSAQDFQAAPPKRIPLPMMVLLGAGLSLLAILVVVATMNRSSALRPEADRQRAVQG